MKKHILSNYLKRVKKIVAPSTDNSVLTESIETTDPDEFSIDNISETRSIKTSDPDDFCFLDSTTYETNTIETSDAYEFYDTTKTTFIVEQSDPDEFALL